MAKFKKGTDVAIVASDEVVTVTGNKQGNVHIETAMAVAGTYKEDELRELTIAEKEEIAKLDNASELKVIIANDSVVTIMGTSDEGILIKTAEGDEFLAQPADLRDLTPEEVEEFGGQVEGDDSAGEEKDVKVPKFAHRTDETADALKECKTLGEMAALVANTAVDANDTNKNYKGKTVDEIVEMITAKYGDKNPGMQRMNCGNLIRGIHNRVAKAATKASEADLAEDNAENAENKEASTEE